MPDFACSLLLTEFAGLVGAFRCAAEHGYGSFEMPDHIGQQQRLCLARGLAVEPEIILGDEATSALDPISTRKIEELFLVLKSKYTIVLVTHTLRQARRIADYAAFMYLGKLVEFGTSEQVFNHPAKKLTQDYINGSFS